MYAYSIQKEIMRVLMLLLGLLGIFLLASGISGWVNALSSGEVVGGFFGLIFGISFTIVGGVILVVDLIILLLYLRNQKKKEEVKK